MSTQIHANTDVYTNMYRHVLCYYPYPNDAIIRSLSKLTKIKNTISR